MYTPPANPALPPDYRLLGTTAQIREPGNPFVRTGVMFGPRDVADPGRQASNEGGVLVSVENGSKMAQALGADRTIDGHPAVASQGLLIMFGFASGFAVEVQGVGGEDALLAAARAVQLVPNPDDRSTWTDQPLR